MKNMEEHEMMMHEFEQISARLDKLKAILTKNEVVAALIRGEEGPRGPAGPVGPTGAKGEKGEKGDRGERGEQGPRGLQGERGERGERGEKGEQGKDGKDGVAGSPDTALDIIQKINSSEVKADFQIDAKHIKNLPQSAWPDGGVIGTTGAYLRYESPSAVNGSTTVYSIVNQPKGILLLFKNGVTLERGTAKDYTISGRIITLTNPIVAGDTLWVAY